MKQRRRLVAINHFIAVDVQTLAVKKKHCLQLYSSSKKLDWNRAFCHDSRQTDSDLLKIINKTAATLWKVAIF